VFANNIAHSTKRYGLRISPYIPVQNPCTAALTATSNPYAANPAVYAEFSNFVTFKN